MATVGVLCARSRVEEKALMAALAEAGIVSALFPPADEPLPVGPSPVSPCGNQFPVPQIVIDRHPNRQIARAVLSACRALGVPVLSAGIAATGDRLDVASELERAGVPRPRTALCTSEEAALKAVRAMGLPATLMPLDLQSPGITLLDEDAAEAILEHRAVLGSTGQSLNLVQAEVPHPDELTTVMVIDGMAWTAQNGHAAAANSTVRRLAEETALALRADLVAVTLFVRDEDVLVWDVTPVPDFRHAVPLFGPDVAHLIALAVERRLEAQAAKASQGTQTIVMEMEAAPNWISITQERVLGDVVVSA
jgi:[lysine-biosynthesis-protein LysW]--L-2-aminoadipate ligase